MMNRINLLTIFALLSANAYAKTADDVCPYAGKLAEQIMISRQSGIEISQFLKDVKFEPEIRKSARKMVFDAYAIPLMKSEASKTEAIRSFKESVEVRCYRELSD